MSTKVYMAYRLKRGVDVETWMAKTLQKARKQAMATLVNRAVTLQMMSQKDRRANVKNFFKQLFSGSDEDVAALHNLSRVEYDLSKNKLDIVSADTLLRMLYGVQTLTDIRNHYDFSVGLMLRLYNKRWYITLRYEPLAIGKIFEFLEHDQDLEDYSYWNNSDRPDDISDAEWNRRGEVWKVILEESYPKLYLSVVSVEDWFETSPYKHAVQQQMKRKKK